VMRDNADPWGMTVRRFRTPAGRFQLMSHREAARFSGVSAKRLPAVRVIEDGPVRVVIESLLQHGNSAICQRYKLPRTGTEIEVETRVLWQEKDRMLKLSLPTPWRAGRALGQVAYGVQELPSTGDEAVAQKWLALVSPGESGQSSSKRSGSDPRALTVINDSTYGCDFQRGELRLSLLRAPAHAGHPTGTDRPIVQQDRFVPRMDQGEYVFRFWLNGGQAKDRLSAVDREALAHNEPCPTLSYWPSGEGDLPAAGPVLSDRAVQVTAFKSAEDGDDLIVRLFEPTGRARRTTLSLDCAGATDKPDGSRGDDRVEYRTQVRLRPFELKTLRLNRRSGQFSEVSLLEE